MIAISGGVEGSGWLTFSTPFLDPGCSKQAWRSSDKQDSVALPVLMRAEAACPARIIYTANLNLKTKVLGLLSIHRVGDFSWSVAHISADLRGTIPD